MQHRGPNRHAGRAKFQMALPPGRRSPKLIFGWSSRRTDPEEDGVKEEGEGPLRMERKKIKGAKEQKERRKKEKERKNGMIRGGETE